jgi:pectate lyase
MKNQLARLAVLFFFVACMANKATAQTVLFDFNFQTTTLPGGITSDGTMNPTKAADGICSMGMLQVNSGGFMQVEASSCGMFTLNMKSTGGSARSVTVKYKKSGDAGFTSLTPALSVLAAAQFNLTALYPALVSSGSISVRLEPTNGNIQIHDLYVTANSAASTEAEITTFKLLGQVGNEIINSAAGTVSVNVATGTSLASVAPQQLTVSAAATVSPAATAAQNFTAPVTYTVTAQNGTSKSWTVTATQVTSSAKEITAFKLSNNQIGDAVINSTAGTVSVTMPNSAPLSNLTPLSLVISPNAVVTPSAATARNFSSPVTYTVTAQDNSTKTWTVTVTSVASSYPFNFENVIGFASITADGFTGPTTGGQNAPDTLVINGPAEFNKLCEGLYNRQQAYKTNTTVGGMKKAKLVIYLKSGIYDGTQTLSTNGAKVFGNYMLDIPEQGDLTFMGQSGVVFKIGINVKRSYNVLIRNIFFQDYYDDGINIGYPETHHIWIDHCTIGHPTALPTDTEHPDGGCDIKDGASYVTVSWCLFRNSWKTSLVGHSDNNGATDNGRLKVTYANNYFLGTNSRNPRVRFGQVHVLNNLMDGVKLYGTVATNNSQVFVENNFYLNTDWPMYADRTVADFKAVYGNNTDDTYTSKTGNYPAVGLKQTGNEYDDNGLPVITAQIAPAMLNPGGRSVKFDEANPGAVFSPSAFYPYTPLSASATRSMVPLYAGADKVIFGASNSPLPIKLLSFTVSLDRDKKAKAVWITTEEKNAKTFDLQRSGSGIDFATIGSVTAKNTVGVSRYDFTDALPLKGLSYYRLKQTDGDLKTTYSSVVRITNNEGHAISIYPNPVSQGLMVTHPYSNAGLLRVLTLEGKILRVVRANGGITTISANELPAGQYLVQFNDNGVTTTQKFLKK